MAHIQVSIGEKKASRQDPKDLFKTNMQIKKSTTEFMHYKLFVGLLSSRSQVWIIMQGFIFLVATVFITNLQNT